MNEDLLLRLYNLSALSPDQLRERDPELLSAVEAAAGEWRGAAIAARLTGSAEAARPQVSRAAAVGPGTAPEELRNALLAALRAEALPEESVREAELRIRELSLSVLADPLATDVPLRDNPAIRGELERAKLHVVGHIFDLPEPKVEAIVEKTSTLAGVDDIVLGSLIASGALSDEETKAMGLGVSLFNLLDGDAGLVSAIRAEVHEPSDLAKLDANRWRKVLDQANLTPPGDLTREAYATALAERVDALFPGAALLERIIPADPRTLVAGLEAMDPAARTRLANRFPGLRLDEILENAAVPAPERADRVAGRIAVLGRVRELNPGTDFLALDYSPESEQAAKLRFDGISAEDQRMALASLKSYQRAFAYTRHVSDAVRVLEVGYPSVSAVLRDGFEKFAQKTGLRPAAAERYYHRALATMGSVTATAGSVIDLVTGGFDSLQIANTGPDILDYLRKLDGFADLFGSQTTCRCEHCQSILSPAAYFVDLMCFVDEHVLQHYFGGARAGHVLNLKVRRPDLWTLQLTCENTNTRIPTLDIVNEVLENYVAQRRGFAGLFSDRAAVEQVVYQEEIITHVDSFRQPFVLPLERLETYLAHFGQTRASVAATLDSAQVVRTASRLGLSRREYELITQANPDLPFLRQIYGIDFQVDGGGIVAPFDVQLLLAPMGLTRDELGAVAGTRFVSAGVAGVAIRAEKTDPNSVQNDIERVSNASAGSLDRMHRFVRLLRRLPWSQNESRRVQSIGELDVVLAQLGGALDPAMLDRLVQALAAGDRLGGSVEDLSAFWSDLPQTPVVAGRSSLFDRAFNVPFFVKVDGTYPKDMTRFVHPSFQAAPAPADATLHRLLAGLRVSEEDLLRLITNLAGPLGVNLAAANEDDRGFTLTVAHLSLLYRHARLAQALKLSTPDLFQLIGHAKLADGHVADLDRLTRLLEFHGWWKASGYSLDDIGYVTHGMVQHAESYPDPAGLAQQIVDEVAADRALVFADTIFAFVQGVTEAQSRDIVAANAAAIQPAPDGAGYRLAGAFSLSAAAPLAMPPGVAITDDQAKELLKRHHASRIIPQRLGAMLGLSLERTEVLIAMTGADLSTADIVRELQRDAAPPATLAGLIKHVLPLSVLFRKPPWDAPALDFVRTHQLIFGINDFHVIEIGSVRKLSVYATLTDTGGTASFTGTAVPLDPADVRSVLAAFDLVQKFTLADKAQLARVLRAEPGLVVTIAARVSLPDTAPEALAKLVRCLVLARQLGVSGEALFLIVSDDYRELMNAADAVLSAFRAKYGDERDWLEKLEPFDDRIRAGKRGALVDYLIHSIGHEFTTASDLYQHFLLDVELDGCARTSRVVAAISSLQLYVHRCLLNLEQDRLPPLDPKHVHVLPDSIPVDEWGWRKNYRVWEANRKVFLYPENYIEPELRDDKTPLFEEMESELLQQDINDETVLNAYAKYLRGFEEVATLRMAGVYHVIDGETEQDVLHLFGRALGDPPAFYYRTAENLFYGERLGRGVVWSPWRKLQVQVSSMRVSPVVYQSRLYLFWPEYSTRPVNQVSGGGSEFAGYDHTMRLKFTTLRLDGSWTPPQELALPAELPFDGSAGRIRDRFWNSADKTPRLDTREHQEPLDDYRLAGPNWEEIYFRAEGGAFEPLLTISARNLKLYTAVDFYKRAVRSPRQPGVDGFPPGVTVLCARRNPRRLYYGEPGLSYVGTVNGFANLVIDEPRIDIHMRDGIPTWTIRFDYRGLYTRELAVIGEEAELMAVSGNWMSFENAIVQHDSDVLMLQAHSSKRYLLRRIGTTLAETIGEKLFVDGVDGLLDTSYQMSLKERPIPITITSTQLEDGSKAGRLDYAGPYGVYYREIFFHIPFLIANHLNSQQHFSAAQRWYHYIFNPTASQHTVLPVNLDQQLRDRNWRYAEFRGLDVPKLREILGDPQAIDVYRRDPFNPHAIARLRLSAYQKCVVMKYIDNLLDWGDSLFSQFATEAVNEATLLYVLAADILGARPAELGDCGEGKVAPKDYETIEPLVKQGSEFLVELETYVLGRTAAVAQDGIAGMNSGRVIDTSWVRNRLELARQGAGTLAGVAGPGIAAVPDAPGAATLPAALRASDLPPVGVFRGGDWTRTRTASWSSTNVASMRRRDVIRSLEPATTLITDGSRVPSFGWSLIRQVSPVFCVPGNKELREYWDRVEDRLYKVRHCMDIAGVRRELALFAPEIDPRLLVRMRAAGLSLEDVLNVTSGNLPPYRFAYLIERAKGYASTLQSLGAALLSALEKKDAEELSRLRTLHQQHLLQLTTKARQWDIEMAEQTIQSLERQKEATTYRRDYYQGLSEGGLSAWERTQQVSRHTASATSVGAALLSGSAGALHLLPQIGSPFAMKYGGVELGSSGKEWAKVLRDTAAVAEVVSASAGLEAGFQRRGEGWEHQVELANHELRQIERNLEAARIRKDIAAKSLELHERTIEQTEEMFEYFGEKFSNLGRYTWLSTSLQRMYREAYNSAYAMARLAEQAYRFERGDEITRLLQPTYWDPTHAGLLAGERLLIDLQSLERRFLETNYRTLEIDQSFSLTQVDAGALLRLRETGSCEFKIPEVFFDLFYPGQYRRRIRAVRLTIPSVTGPFTNVSGTLTLTASHVRNEPKPGLAFLREVPRRRSVSVATSSAQGDAGVFEFSFRDERYMPFEGAGAVSSWRLSLPKNFRPFDYHTINDVIIQISYSAEEDALFREKVEEQTAALEGTILNYLSNTPMARVLSFRQDFSGALNRLMHSPPDTPVKVEISEKYLPVFLRNRMLNVTKASLALATSNGQPVNGFQIAIDGTDQAGFGRDPQFGDLWAKDLGGLFGGGLLGEHTFVIKAAGDLAPAAPPPGDPSAIDSGKLLDVILHLELQLA